MLTNTSGFEVSAETISNYNSPSINRRKKVAITSAKVCICGVFYGRNGVQSEKRWNCSKMYILCVYWSRFRRAKEVLSLHIGGVESAKYWVSAMNDLKSRGVQDVLIFCTDNLTGISEAIKACYPQSDHQKCIVHQIRNSVKHVSYKDLKAVCADLK